MLGPRPLALSLSGLLALTGCQTPAVSSNQTQKSNCLVSWDMAALPTDGSHFECHVHWVGDGLAIHSAELMGDKINGSAMLLNSTKPQRAVAHLVDDILRRSWLAKVVGAEEIGPPTQVVVPWGQEAEVRNFKINEYDCKSWAGHEIVEDKSIPERVWIDRRVGYVCSLHYPPEDLLDAVRYSWEA